MKTTTIAAIAAVVLVLLAFVVAPAMAANADNDLYTSKYAQPPADKVPYKGTLRGILRAGFALDQTIIAYGPETVKMIAGDDGRFEADLLPGNYTIVLADGNGGQTEFSSASIVAGQISYPEKEILGHAITPVTAKADIYEVLRAQYGMIETRYRTIVDSQAWTENIPAVTHQQYVVDVPAQPAVPAVTHQDYEAGHVHAKKVGSHSAHDFIYNWDKYQITGSKNDDAFIVHSYFDAHRAQIVTIIDVPAIPAVPEQGHYITVVDTPAQTIEHAAETHQEAYTVGSYVDVSAEIQAALDAGVRDIVFDNAKTPGGLFDAEGNLLAAINDPAPGIVKKVNIVYTLNGVQKSVDADEYEVINL